MTSTDKNVFNPQTGMSVVLRKEKFLAERKTYVLGGNHYYQEELKFIQFRELMELIAPLQDALLGETVEGKAPKLDIQKIVDALGEDLLRAVAIVLIPEGKTVRDRNEEAAIADLEIQSLNTIEEIISDFFSLNDLRSHVSRWTSIVGKIAGEAGKRKKPTGTKSSSPSAKGTSEKESKSDTKSP